MPIRPRAQSHPITETYRHGLPRLCQLTSPKLIMFSCRVILSNNNSNRASYKMCNRRQPSSPSCTSRNSRISRSTSYQLITLTSRILTRYPSSLRTRKTCSPTSQASYTAITMATCLTREATAQRTSMTHRKLMGGLEFPAFLSLQQSLTKRST